MEVQTLHVRDIDGEKLVQAVGERMKLEVCVACVSEEVRASLFPVKRLLRESWGFVVLVFAGIALTLTVSIREVMMALRILGPLAVLVGALGIVEKVRESLKVRELVAGMTDDEREKFCAWRCALRSAPKKSGDNDITYIPLDDANNLTPEELAVKYILLLPIARKIVNKE